MRVNDDIREYARVKGVKLWQVADGYGVADTTFCKKLRFELPAVERKRILDIIDELAQEQA